MKTSHLLLGAGLLGSAAVAVFGDRGDTSVAEPAARRAPRDADERLGTTSPSPAPRADAASGGKPHVPVAIAALRPRAELMKHATAQIFASQTFDPPPPPPPKPPPSAPAAPPTAPPLPFTYLGKKLDNQAWEVWLAMGDKTLYVRNGSIVETDYVVNSIKPPLMTLTYLPMKQTQTLTIGGAE